MRRALMELYAQPVVSRLYAHMADTRLPRPVLRRVLDKWVDHFGVDMGESAEPLGAFGTLDAFFTRALKEGARPIEGEANDLVSASDGTLVDSSPLDSDTMIQAKGRTYTVAELVGSKESAERLVGGYTYNVYLAPGNYHRVHSPASGRVVRWRHVPGRLYPVHAFSRAEVDRLFCRNERLVVELETELGLCVVVLVGATLVGRITASFADITTNDGQREVRECTPDPAVHLARGDHLGTFHMGSTVIVLHETRHSASARPDVGDPVRMGQRLAAPGDQT